MFTLATTITIIRSLQDSLSNSMDSMQFWQNLRLSDPQAYEERGGVEEEKHAKSVLLAQETALEDFRVMLDCVVSVSTERHVLHGSEGFGNRRRPR